MIIGIIIAIFAGIWVAGDANKRGMNGLGWGFFSFAILIIGLPLYLLERKKHPIQNQSQNNTVKQNFNNDSAGAIVIPDVCPHCKNPNAKRIRICEWCGSQIV
jgi:hypothetical protein